MSIEIAPIREDEAEDMGRTTTPEPTGSRWQKRSPGAASLTPIGSPTPYQEKLCLDQDRPHANSFTFCDPFRAQERPNSAPAERGLGMLSPPLSGGVYSAHDASIEEVGGEPTLIRMPTQASKPLSPEQPTFHPQPRRHQPWVTPLLESEASPNLQSPEASKQAARPKALTGLDESRVPTPVGEGASATPAPAQESTPSPERELATGRSTWDKELLDSPNPAASHRSIQNTPEPTHYQYGSFGGSAGAPISTPSPCAMSALNHQHYLGLPRFPTDSGLAMPVLPPPLPTPGGSGPASDIGMGFGGAFRPGAEVAIDGERQQPVVEAKPMNPAELQTFWGLRAQDPLMHQLAAAAGFQAYHWGAAAAAALGGLQSTGWRLPGCHGCMDPANAQAVPQNGEETNAGGQPTGGAALAPGPVYACPSAPRNSAPNAPAEEWQVSASDPRKGRGRGEAETLAVNGKGGKGRGGANGSARGRFDVSTLPAEAAELLGQVGQLSRSQAGSKYLQRQLQKGQGAIVEVILAEVEDEIAGMMCDSYGNYLCSAAFQACDQRQRKRILEKLSPQVAGIACDKRGTHALQALIGLLQVEDEQLQLMNAIKGRVIQLSMDPNGTHVVQRLLCCFFPSVINWIYIAINDRLIEVAHHPYGLCVLKKCISQAKKPGNHQDMLLKQLARHAMDLVQSPYGNYAVQHALEEWGGDRCQPILQKLEGRMMQLSIQKFSSNVVEKLFCAAPAEFRARFIAELVESEKMSELINSNYGHYVAKRALQMATPEQSRALSEAIKANLSMLPNRRLRVKWEKVMSGQGDLDDDLHEALKPVIPQPEKSSAKRRGLRPRRGRGDAVAVGVAEQ